MALSGCHFGDISQQTDFCFVRLVALTLDGWMDDEVTFSVLQPTLMFHHHQLGNVK